jgi:hypothetical protein
VKKLISIGVALALLTMVVVPGAVAAYTTPPTYSKVPFAIIQSGFELLENIWPTLNDILGLGYPTLGPVLGTIGEWAGGPLSWTVDMLAWGVSLAGAVLDSLSALITLPAGLDLAALMDTIACGLMWCWSATNCTGNFTPCG